MSTRDWSPLALLFVSQSKLTLQSMMNSFRLDAIWSGFWGLFYRKFFWDFVGGTLRDPGGLQ